MAKTIEITVSGVPQLKAALAALGSNASDGLSAELYRVGQEVLAESQPEVPVDIGTLKASGFVNEPVKNGDEVSVTIGYGGAAKAYALIQHENLTYRHTVGKAKYLEHPFLRAAAGLAETLADRLKRRLGT